MDRLRYDAAVPYQIAVCAVLHFGVLRSCSPFEKTNLTFH